MKPIRQSIIPTYDGRETGQRFTVEYSVNGKVLDKTPITDPFVRGRVTVSWRDLLKCLLRRKPLVVGFWVDGDSDIVNDVMELDGNYLVPNSTRWYKFKGGIENTLSRLAMEPMDEELN